MSQKDDGVGTLGAIRSNPVREDGRLAVAAKRVIRQKAAGRTNETLAAALQVHKDTLNHWANGKGGGGLTVRQLQKLCNLLGVTPNDLLLEPEELAASRLAEALVVAREMVDAAFEQELKNLDSGTGAANGTLPPQPGPGGPKDTSSGPPPSTPTT